MEPNEESLIPDQEKSGAGEEIAKKADAILKKLDATSSPPNEEADMANISDDNMGQVDEKSELKLQETNANKLISMPHLPKVPGGGMAPLPSRTLPKQTKKEEMKYSDYLKQEKMRNFKRLPKLVGNRNPVPFTCPSCKKEGVTQTSNEFTGTQICMCVTCCCLGCYLTCCFPFCCCRMYNKKHSCPKCYY